MEKVIFTRKLSVLEFGWSFLNGIIPVIKPMIKIKAQPLLTEHRVLLASLEFNYLVFTSKNAVKYYKRHYRFRKKPAHLKNVAFIVIGERTAKPLRKYKNPIHVFDFKKHTHFSDFVKSITNQTPYLYFCSDLAAVKWQWQSNHTNYNIIELYRTIASSSEINTQGFKRFVFMSSSAVNSFFQKNMQLSDNKICYALGEPTRSTLSNYFKGPIFTPSNLSFWSIVKQIKRTK